MTEQEENTLNRLLGMVQDLDASAASDGANDYHPSVRTERLYKEFAMALRQALEAQRQAGQEPVAQRLRTEHERRDDAAESVADTNAVLATRYFELLKTVEAYEKHGVTCQTYRHFVDAPCAECNAAAPSAPDVLTQIAVLLDEAMTVSGRPWPVLVTEARLLIGRYAETPPAAQVPEAKVCHWSSDEDGTHHTDCGNLFAFTDGGPKDNEAKFCCYCGGALVADPA